MRLQLSVCQNDREIRVVTLTGAQSAIFGRSSPTSNADFQFVDSNLSRKHFQVFPEQGLWKVSDLESSNGTYVNSKRVSQAILKQSDVLLAGSLQIKVVTCLSVSSVDSIPLDTEETLQEAAVLAIQGKLNIVVSLDVSESGRTFVQGDTSQRKISEIILALKQSPQFGRVWLMIDTNRITQPLPESLAAVATPIVDWLGDEYAQHVSPRLIKLSTTSYKVWEAVINEAWGQDALVVLFSAQKQPAMLEALRLAAHQKTAIAGIFWPSVLHYILLKGTSEISGTLMSNCTGILMEFADLPEQWLMVGHPELPKSLKQLGIQCQDSAPKPKLESKTEASDAPGR